MEEEKIEADRHHDYREKQKQLNCSLREYANELESTVETLEEQNANLQNRVIELETENLVLTENSRISERAEEEYNVILLAIQEQPSAVGESFDNVSEMGTQTENDKDVSQYKRLEQENSFLKQEYNKLKNENRMMRCLGSLIATTSFFEGENQDSSVQGDEQVTESNSIEEGNVQPESNNSFGPIEYLDGQVDRTQLLQTSTPNQGFEPPAVDGWNFSEMFQQDELVAQSTTPATSLNTYSIQKDSSAETQAIGQESVHQAHDEMEIS